MSHDDVIKRKHFPRYWPFGRGIHRSPVSFPHQGQCRGAVMFSLICVWINGWVNNREAGDLRHYRSHYDVSVMSYGFSERVCLNFLRGCAKGTCRPGDRFENCYHGDLSNSSHCKQFDDGMPINQKYWIYGYWSFQWMNGDHSWWRHQMETFSALLAICAGNSPAPGEFPAQRPGTRSFDVFFDLRLNKRLSKQPWGWWFETLLCPFWRHCNVK